MSKQTPVSKPIYSLLPTDVEGFDSLVELAREGEPTDFYSSLSELGWRTTTS